MDPDGPEGEAGSFLQQVREHGPVSRTVRLPERVNEKRTDADPSNGRLRITLPKRERRRTVEVE